MVSNFDSVQDLIEKASKCSIPIYEVVLEEQAIEMGKSKEELYNDMARNLEIMEQSIAKGIKPYVKSQSGLSGGDAYKLQSAFEMGITIGGSMLDKALIKALAISEANACMERIVAAPTAGSCGIIPAVILTIMEEKNISRDKAVMGLFTAGGIGMVIAKRASVSGAQGGCQAECGSASAMAAAALVEMMEGTPEMAGHACAIALKNVLGLVCDPVAGLVEVPCIKRNAMGAANALVSADLALAGIKSIIPVDEVIDAMKSVGNLMMPALKETAEAGLAATPTACKLTKHIFS
ncbi:L-serine ammonia-lyase, iron-sulfur-dependent, subunit alpha [Xylanivirga thermophila]|uniref:L-serine ammonia-lyase, iron-sulfur-dependent, subunit alpha n=1 Tax=Xylanivirga thermophila TaxID=2496273 RepID=UPI0013EE2DF0|nr:L-serine ammonia-lyase, iron-sulfur-dependent, subunit alpha [Xylanivirga thermophila]